MESQETQVQQETPKNKKPVLLIIILVILYVVIMSLISLFQDYHNDFSSLKPPPPIPEVIDPEVGTTDQTNEIVPSMDKSSNNYVEEQNILNAQKIAVEFGSETGNFQGVCDNAEVQNYLKLAEEEWENRVYCFDRYDGFTIQVQNFIDYIPKAHVCIDNKGNTAVLPGLRRYIQECHVPIAIDQSTTIKKIAITSGGKLWSYISDLKEITVNKDEVMEVKWDEMNSYNRNTSAFIFITGIGIDTVNLQIENFDSQVLSYSPKKNEETTIELFAAYCCSPAPILILKPVSIAGDTVTFDISLSQTYWDQ
ncbi:MAG: hypothetical protein A2653_03115 [Candidatus Zambryskibacteria bacterium RIFCSPHIGHO2_01_FULL_43_25]|uniref:Uncharacterized protein n=1 Tax=Candidatus Zambryskibacteria bacterium RIFCSPLOWO2_01_FULL_45_21 TaxID=1802761 RepID=A0A1G2U4F6_9BACT|nr:MAG: hypothetical protein A2653_03115 [Candidatus Zambryskibacteria bacterium RIFCSPHIGHO2_01_FULL_43_25]OHB03702.1 MAG: hypothetical protein A3B14_01505 [Candidatus Zambryskibacteria bacterium RIFCSPLOWO2_01_FULL_45_21]